MSSDGKVLAGSLPTNNGLDKQVSSTSTHHAIEGAAAPVSKSKELLLHEFEGLLETVSAQPSTKNLVRDVMRRANCEEHEAVAAVEVVAGTAFGLPKGMVESDYQEATHEAEQWIKVCQKNEPEVLQEFKERCRHLSTCLKDNLYSVKEVIAPQQEPFETDVIHRFAAPVSSRDIPLVDSWLGKGKVNAYCCNGSCQGECECRLGISVMSVSQHGESFRRAHELLLKIVIKARFIEGAKSLANEADASAKLKGVGEKQLGNLLQMAPLNFILETAERCPTPAPIPACFASSKHIAGFRLLDDPDPDEKKHMFGERNHKLLQPEKPMTISDLNAVALCLQPHGHWQLCPVLIKAAAGVQNFKFSLDPPFHFPVLAALFETLLEYAESSALLPAPGDLFDACWFLCALSPTYTTREAIDEMFLRRKKLHLPQRLAKILQQAMDAECGPFDHPLYADLKSAVQASSHLRIARADEDVEETETPNVLDSSPECEGDWISPGFLVVYGNNPPREDRVFEDASGFSREALSIDGSEIARLLFLDDSWREKVKRLIENPSTSQEDLDKELSKCMPQSCRQDAFTMAGKCFQSSKAALTASSVIALVFNESVETRNRLHLILNSNQEVGDYLVKIFSFKLSLSQRENEGEDISPLATEMFFARLSTHKPPRFSSHSIDPPTMEDAVYLTVFDIRGVRFGKNFGINASKIVQDGLHVLRKNLWVLRNSFMIWHINYTDASFDLEKAYFNNRFFKHQGQRKSERELESELWASRFVGVTQKEVSRHNLSFRGVELRTASPEANCLVMLSWNKSFAKEAEPEIESMLSRMLPTASKHVILRLCVEFLNTDNPSIGMF